MRRVHSEDRGYESQCWIFEGGLGAYGYGSIRLANPRRRTSTHRFAYEHYVGPIPEGLQIDHLCRVLLNGSKKRTNYNLVSNDIDILVTFQ